MLSAKPTPSGSRAPATMVPRDGSTTSPSAFTAARAPTTKPSGSLTAAEPRPPRMARWGPNIFPTDAPAPAPTFPTATGSEEADSAARNPDSAFGRTAGSPTPKSNRIAAGTIGTTASPTGNPTPSPSKKRITPSAAAKPYALPPDSTTACTLATLASGLSRSVSRVPGPPPRTSTPAIAPPLVNTAVQPVEPEACVQCPTRIPGTAVNVEFTGLSAPKTHGANHRLAPQRSTRRRETLPSVPEQAMPRRRAASL